MTPHTRASTLNTDCHEAECVQCKNRHCYGCGPGAAFFVIIISVTSIIAWSVPSFLFLFFVSVHISQSMMQADILRRRLLGDQRKT